MEVAAWSNGSGTYGIRVGKRNRNRYFVPAWTRIEVEIDGQFCDFKLPLAFWNKCPEFRDAGGVTAIREWLKRYYTIDWPIRQPPRFQLVPLDGIRFRLVAWESEDKACPTALAPLVIPSD